MKLFWKLFCSMVIVTVLACSLGGYFLIDEQLRSSEIGRASCRERV